MTSSTAKDYRPSNILNSLNGSKDLRSKKLLPHRWLNQPLSQPLESLDPGENLELQVPQDHLDQRENQEGMVPREWMESKVLQEML
jgi:hypothetical protein